MSVAVKRAKALRRNSTDAEKAFWRKVRDRQLGHKFYRQFPVNAYVADFACPELRLIVEIDGGQHNGSVNDEVRTVALNKSGYEVVRFWNNEVLGNMDGVLVALMQVLAARQKKSMEPWVQS